MTNALIQIAIFIGIGVAWRYVKPMGVNAGTLQRNLFTLIYAVLLPIIVFIAMTKLKMDKYTIRQILYILLSTGAAVAASWFIFKQLKLPGRMRGALVLASSFGAVAFLGMPVIDMMPIKDWTSRYMIEYIVFANVILMYVVGAFLLSEGKDPVNSLKTIIKEPLFWAAVAGLVVGMTGMKLPSAAWTLNAYVTKALPPIMLITLGLSLYWNQDWNKIVVRGLLPAAAIKIILVPVVIFILYKVVGTPGKTALRVMMLGAIMPSFMFGFVACERYKLDSTTYTAAVTFTTVLSLIALPFVYGMRF